MMRNFPKSERLCSRRAIEELFSTGKILFHYPLKMLWKEFNPENEQLVQIAISVPKKRIRKAADRNRIKRLIREAYRLNKSVIHNELSDGGRSVKMMLIYVAPGEVVFDVIDNSMQQLMQKLTRDENVG